MSNKMFRSNGYIGGVCGGLGEWSGIPSILFRIAFLFFIPFGIWIYLGLWIILMEDEEDC